MDFLRDARYAFALVRRERRFAATALVTLALGIGATTAVFSVVYGVLLRPLPYADADRLVRLYEEHPGAPQPPGEPPLTNITMYAWQARMRTLEDVAAYYAREYTVVIDGEATRVHGAEAAPALFPLLRAATVAGRFYRAGEDAPDANRFVVIGERFWRERFGRDPSAIGRSLVVEAKPHVIVGVAAAGFRFPDRDVQIWTPYDDPTRTEASVQGGIWLAPTLGRLKPGVSPAQAAAEGTTAARSVTRPATATVLFGEGGPVQVRVERLADQMTARVRPALVVLAVGVVFVLLVSCSNVANLFLSRGVTRQRELAVRAAIGASRAQLVRQLLAESVVLAALGGALGIAVGWALVRVVPALAPEDFPRLDAIRLDTVTLVFAAAASLAAAVMSGLAPALRGARVDLVTALHPGDGAPTGAAGGSRRLRDALLVAESALATVLLIGAALLGRSFARLTDVDPGYDAANVLIARVYPPPGVTSERRAQFADTLVARLRERSTVVAAGAGNMMPFNDSSWVTSFSLPPAANGARSGKVRSLAYIVTPGYAEALGIRLREGRLLDASDAAPSRRPRLVVNREFVRQHRLDGVVAGRAFASGPFKGSGFEIVGVVDDVLKDGNDARPQPEFYAVATAARPIQDEVNVVLRMAGDPSAGAAILRAAVRETDRGAAIGEIMPLAARVSASTAQPRFATAVLAAFAGLALLLASVGLYGMLSYTVARRARELGVRAALGAGRGDLARLVVGEGLGRVVAGVAVGALLAVGLTRLMTGLLFGVTPLDPITYAVAPALLVPIAVLACLAPARRAASSDPAIALRGE